MIKYLFLLLLLFNLSCKDKQLIDNTEETKITSIGISVTSKFIEQTDFQKEIITNGLVEALKKSEIRFKTSERIASIKVKNGQKVNRGQTLAVLDNKTIYYSFSPLPNLYKYNILTKKHRK
jgi:multidrug efflux pump subunit AcrA (membrane-fusion protein)